MAFLVDQLLDRHVKWTRGGNTHSCHLATDITDQRGLAALCEFANILGLRDQWLQWGGRGRRLPHFDLTEYTRMGAINLGAEPVDMRVLLVRCRWPADSELLPFARVVRGLRGR